MLTHTHSDHVGNLDTLAASTRLLVSREELVPAARSGRLLPKLPQDGRVQQTVRGATRGAFGPVMPLTSRGDIFVVATPGHTPGHQSVVIDLGARRIVLAGDAAFDDDQVARGTIPGIVEQRTAALATYDLLNRAAQEKLTLTLFTHDPANAAKLATFAQPGSTPGSGFRDGPDALHDPGILEGHDPIGKFEDAIERQLGPVTSLHMHGD